MTATSRTRRGRNARFPSMEALGFFDTPAEATVTYAASRPMPVPSTFTTRPLAPSGDMVQDLWDSTELDAPPLLDWKPTVLDRKHLRRQNFRWSRVFLILIIIMAFGVGAYWLYQSSSTSAAASVVAVEDDATALSAALDGVSEIGKQLSAPDIEMSLSASDLFEVDDTARDLFEASGDLPGSETAAGTIAAEAATLSLNASRQLREGLAYRGAVEPILLAPAFETDPALTDLATASLEFSEWRSHFDSIRSALPERVAVALTAALEDFSSGLETRQGSYLDAIRTNDRNGAEAAVRTLESDLETIRGLMMTTMTGLANEVDSQIDEAQALIGRLLA